LHVVTRAIALNEGVSSAADAPCIHARKPRQWTAARAAPADLLPEQGRSKQIQR